MKKETLELALMLVIGVAIGALGAKLWLGDASVVSSEKEGDDTVLSSDDKATTTNTGANNMAAEDGLTKVSDLPGVGVAPKNTRMGLHVDDQVAGDKVKVSGFTFVEPGWVAIYDNRDGKPGWILGAKRFLNGDTSGEVPLLRSTVSGETYYAIFHHDDGNLTFDKSTDKLPPASGVIMVSFEAR